jgi:hypothetical protein
MIQFVTQPSPARSVAADWHQPFLAMLPKILGYARVAFRALRPEARDNAVHEVVANVLSAYVRLVTLDKSSVAYPSALTRYAVAQVREGRRVGTKLNSHDVLSEYARRKKGFHIERLDHFDDTESEWKEAVVEDHQTPVAEQAAFRIDFPAWLKTLTRRDHRIAQRLACGHSTTDVAREFGLSLGRISQKRREFHASWHEFHGEAIADA